MHHRSGSNGVYIARVVRLFVEGSDAKVGLRWLYRGTDLQELQASPLILPEPNPRA